MQSAKAKLSETGISRWREELAIKAKKLGFAQIGIARAELPVQHSGRLREWVDGGAHGDMEWMEDRLDERAQPSALWGDVKSAIMLGMSYAPSEDPMALEKAVDHGRNFGLRAGYGLSQGAQKSAETARTLGGRNHWSRGQGFCRYRPC